MYMRGALAMFRFSIRDWFWLTLVVGLAVGWWLEQFQRDYLSEHAIRFEREKRLEAEESLGRRQKLLSGHSHWRCGFSEICDSPKRP